MAAPSKPTSPDATATSSDEITVSWTNGDTYDRVYVEYNATGVWHTYTALSGSATERVNSVTENVEWTFRVRGWVSVDGYSDYSDEVSATCHTSTVSGTINVSSSAGHAVGYKQTVSGTINVSASASHAVGYTQTVSGTINVTASTSSAKTLKTDYSYYLGTTDGTTHIFSDTYKGDAGAVISCKYETKDTDFSEQGQQSNDKWKTVYAVKLFYEDLSADTEMTMSISSDSGVTWVNSTHTLGTGNEKRKDTTFYFVTSGQFFRFKVSSGSASTTFKLLGIEAEYEESGTHWVTA